MSFIKIVFLSLIAISCAHGPTTSTSSSDIAHSDAVPNGMVTFAGESQHSRFSNDGTMLIFESRNRTRHDNSQIYILNLQNGHEKRITYNDGQDTSPDFDKTGNFIVYSSTTDEQKENPDQGGADIYESGADGSHIHRLTQAKGFDGDPVYSKDGKIFFSSNRDGDFELYEMNSQGNFQKRLTHIKGQDREPSISPDGKFMVWSGLREDQKGQQIFLSDSRAKEIRTLTKKEAIHQNPVWTSDGKTIVFSSNREDGKRFRLYSISTDGACLKKIRETEKGDELYPALSSDGKKMTYTSNRTGTFQIFISEFSETSDCLAEQP